MAFVTAGDGTEIYYKIEGEGFPLVFTHGNMGFGEQFFYRLKCFASAIAAFCTTREAAGYRESRAPRSVTQQLTPRIYTLFCELCDWRKPFIQALLWGPIALHYYFDHPKEVAGLIFIGSYSAGRQLAITEDQVLSFYDTIKAGKKCLKPS